MNIKPYSKYKPSGIEWFGALPSHWVVKRLRFATERIEQGWSPQCDNQAADDDAWGVMKVGCVNGDQFDASENKALPPELDPKTEYELRPGDVLISRANTRELVGSAAIVPSDVRSKLLLCDKLFRIALSPEVDAAYLTFCLRTRAARFQYEQDATGASGSMQNIGQDAIKNLVFPFPSYAEQQQIAAFLDWKTDQIDALIAKKQALLQKLKEKRLAVITQAVTKGLNPDAPMRDSGIAWLGKVPAHWGVKRLKFVAHVGNGSTPNREDSAYWDGGTYPWLNSSVVNQEQVTNADQFVTPLALSECHLPRISPPAVLVGITGQGKTRGMATTLLFEATINQHLAYVKPDEAKASVGFLRRVFDMAYAHLRIESENGGSTKGAITCEQIAELPIPVPPLDEQVVISERIDMALAKLARMSDNAKSAITRLTEYRSALITAATTGKIDVRGWQAPQETV